MRTRKQLLGGLVFALLAASVAAAHGCGSDPDTPTPTAKQYPPDAVDAVPVTETLKIPELSEPVRVVRDQRGMVHVYARNLRDAALAQGYMMARDRAPQLELLRRIAEGRLAELLGNLQPSLADRDISMRMLGLRRTAEKTYAAMKDGSDAKLILDGYAAGVSKFFAQIRDPESAFDPQAKQIPSGWLIIRREKYLDWDGPATLAIARLQTFQLSYTADDEIDLTETRQKAFDTFKKDAPDAALAARSGFVLDALRFDPLATRPVLDFPPPATPSATDWKSGPFHVGAPARLDADLLARVKPFGDAIKGTRDMLGVGHWSSNNFIVSPGKSATGNALVASDPHLPLPAPAIFYMSALHVLSDDPAQQLDIAGMSFAGIPGVVLGFNKNVAWGATVAGFDVNDVYQDDVSADGKVTIKSADGTTQQVAIEPINETIDYGDGHPVPIVIESIPGHGNVVPTITNDRWVARSGPGNVIAIRWTGMEPTGEFEGFMNLSRAKSVDEAVSAMQPFQVGAQNFVFGDSSGNIRYTTHSWVPTRPASAFAWDAKTSTGILPCLVMPGDQGLEWNGRISDAQLPNVKNPSWGYVGTANSDQYGLVFDNDPSNDPFYLSCMWDIGFREQRLRERIDGKDKLSLDDIASIQADAKSPLGTRLSKFFVAALQRAEDSRNGVKPAPELDVVIKDPRYDGARMAFVLSVLKQWESLGFDTPAAQPIEGDPIPSNDEITASQAALFFNVSMAQVFKRTFADEVSAMGNPPMMREFLIKALVRILEKPAPLATADATGESVLWDDLTTKDVVETRDQQLLLAMLDGIDFVVKTLGPSPDKWRWGALHGVTFVSMLPGVERQLSIPDQQRGLPPPGFPRHGDEQVLDRSDVGLGSLNPSMNFMYANGPAQRFAANMKPGGAPEVRNALPGGNVWKPGDRWFDNEADLWRRNKNAPVAFTQSDVVTTAAERYDLVPF